jgi:hypothetical protein
MRDFDPGSHLWSCAADHRAYATHDCVRGSSRLEELGHETPIDCLVDLEPPHGSIVLRRMDLLRMTIRISKSGQILQGSERP